MQSPDSTSLSLSALSLVLRSKPFIRLVFLTFTENAVLRPSKWKKSLLRLTVVRMSEYGYIGINKLSTFNLDTSCHRHEKVRTLAAD